MDTPYSVKSKKFDLVVTGVGNLLFQSFFALFICLNLLSDCWRWVLHPYQCPAWSQEKLIQVKSPKDKISPVRKNLKRWRKGFDELAPIFRIGMLTGQKVCMIQWFTFNTLRGELTLERIFDLTLTKIEYMISSVPALG